MGPDPMICGVSFGGANAIHTITDAHSDAQLTPALPTTSARDDSAARLTSYIVVRERGVALSPGSREVVPGLDEDDATDGSRPSRSAAKIPSISMLASSASADGDRSTAMLIIEEDRPRP
jgi:hypothetical protein